MPVFWGSHCDIPRYLRPSASRRRRQSLPLPVARLLMSLHKRLLLGDAGMRNQPVLLEEGGDVRLRQQAQRAQHQLQHGE